MLDLVQNINAATELSFKEKKLFATGVQSDFAEKEAQSVQDGTLKKIKQYLEEIKLTREDQKNLKIYRPSQNGVASYAKRSESGETLSAYA